MDNTKLSDIAEIQSGLVLSRKASKNEDSFYKYKRLTLKSITESGIIDDFSIEPYFATKQIDAQFLTHKNDIVIRMFAPICPALITKSNLELVIPSQLTVIRIKRQDLFLPGFICAFLSDEHITDSIIEGAGSMAQKIIRIGSMSDIKVPLLPLERQQVISAIASEQKNIVSLYSKLIQNENLRTKSLIKNILGGKK